MMNKEERIASCYPLFFCHYPNKKKPHHKVGRVTNLKAIHNVNAVHKDDAKIRQYFYYAIVPAYFFIPTNASATDLSSTLA